MYTQGNILYSLWEHVCNRNLHGMSHVKIWRVVTRQGADVKALVRASLCVPRIASSLVCPEMREWRNGGRRWGPTRNQGLENLCAYLLDCFHPYNGKSMGRFWSGKGHDLTFVLKEHSSGVWKINLGEGENRSSWTSEEAITSLQPRRDQCYLKE